MSQKNTAVLLTGKDGKWQDNVKMEQVAIPEPKGNEALVQLYLRPCNPADMLSVQGVYAGFQPSEFPATPGLEGVGKIVKSAGKFKEGDRVVAKPWPVSTGNGTYQEYYAVAEDLLEPVPDGVSDEQAASFWINPVTAIGFVRELQLKEGDWLLQAAAAGALGRMVIALAKHYKVKTINIVRRSSQKQELLDLGADVVISTEDTEDFVQQVKEVTGGSGATGAIDPVAGEMTTKLLSSVRKNGTVLVYGVLSGLTFTGLVPDILFEGKIIKGFWLKPWFDSLDDQGQEGVVKEIMELLKTKVITEYKGTTYPLKDVVKALEESEKPGRGPKIYLTN